MFPRKPRRESTSLIRSRQKNQRHAPGRRTSCAASAFDACEHAGDSRAGNLPEQPAHYSGEEFNRGRHFGAVRKQTGANVDAPPNATQRVVGQFGPGSPRDVLASVLDASGFNYVLLGSPVDPNGLEHVIITAKSNEPVTNAAVNTPPQPADADTGQNDSSDANDAQEPEQSAPSESFVPQDNPPADDDNSQDQSQNPQIKTPEQLLQELQRQQLLQQQQQQQNQNQGQPDRRSKCIQSSVSPHKVRQAAVHQALHVKR